MKMDEALENLNTLAGESVSDEAPMRTTEELLQFFKNPPQRAYSVPLEEAMTSIVKMFGLADENGRHLVTSKLNRHAQSRLLGYATTMAVLAVRTQSPTLIKQGLIALVLEGGALDYRDSIIAMAKLYHSAVKLGVNAQEVFEEAASLADPGIIREEMIGFPLRQPKDQDLKAFYETEEIAEDGFRYKQILPWSLPERTARTTAHPVETPQQISSRLNRDQQNALIEVAGILAAIAVRTQSPKLVEQGLQGMALGGGTLDPSHSMIALAKLHHSALKLGMNAETAFAEAARLAPPGDLQTKMIGFPLREPKERDLAAFNLHEEVTEKGFGYKQIVPGTAQD